MLFSEVQTLRITLTSHNSVTWTAWLVHCVQYGRRLSDQNQWHSPVHRKALRLRDGYTGECSDTWRDDEYVSKEGCAQELLIITHWGWGEKKTEWGCGWGRGEGWFGLSYFYLDSIKTAAILPSVCETFLHFPSLQWHKKGEREVLSLFNNSCNICGIIKKTKNTAFNAFIKASCGVGAENLISSSALAESIIDFKTACVPLICQCVQL